MDAFSVFLNELNPQGIHVLDKSIPISKYIHINLSIKNELLNKVNVASSSSLEDFVTAHIKTNKGDVAFGGYNEIRNLYQRSTHFNQLDADSERNIHLGIDLWAPAETIIYAPLNGIIHSFKNNANYGDYGPTMILKHHIKPYTFYTLYGHLSLDSLTKLKVGQKVLESDPIATLGDASINGDYPPHLHFQIIKDIQNHQGDYPGVCSKKDLNFYLNNCPDPNTLLKL